jgi:hypothetical protein
MSALAESLYVPERLPEKPHVLAVVNPVTTHAKQAKGIIQQYQDEGLMNWTDIVWTSANSDETDNELHAALTSSKRTYDTVVVLAGDGTLNKVFTFLAEPENKQIREIPVKAGGLGDANDGLSVSYSKFGDKHAISDQPYMPIYLVDIMVLTPEGLVVKRKAALYASLGFSAAAGLNINEQRNPQTTVSKFIDKFPGGHRARDARAIARAWQGHEPFMILDTKSEKARPINEFVVSNSDYMATMPIYPGNPCEPGFESAEISGKWQLLGRVASMAAGKAEWDHTPAGSSRIFEVITFGTDVPLQYDGDTVMVKNGSIVSMHSDLEPVMMVGPKLKPEPQPRGIRNLRAYKA